MKSSLAGSERDLSTEEGSRRAGSIAWQPDHLTLRATLLENPNLGDRSILVAKRVSRWRLQQRREEHNNSQPSPQVKREMVGVWDGLVGMYPTHFRINLTNIPPGSIASYVVQA